MASRSRCLPQPFKTYPKNGGCLKIRGSTNGCFPSSLPKQKEVAPSTPPHKICTAPAPNTQAPASWACCSSSAGASRRAAFAAEAMLDEGMEAGKPSTHWVISGIGGDIRARKSTHTHIHTRFIHIHLHLSYRRICHMKTCIL